MNENEKPGATSATLWSNCLSALAAVAIYTYYPEYFTPELGATWITGKGIWNVALRIFKTKTGIKLN